jgi:hypothetical protein
MERADTFFKSEDKCSGIFEDEEVLLQERKRPAPSSDVVVVSLEELLSFFSNPRTDCRGHTSWSFIQAE